MSRGESDATAAPWLATSMTGLCVAVAAGMDVADSVVAVATAGVATSSMCRRAASATSARAGAR